MTTTRNSHDASKDRETSTISTQIKDRTQINRVLVEVGLNPSDYIFSPLPEDDPSQESTHTQSSAFSNYSRKRKQDSQQVLQPQSQALFVSGRTTAYVQQPPPPPPLPPPSQAAPQTSSNQQQNSPLTQTGPSALSALFGNTQNNQQQNPPSTQVGPSALSALFGNTQNNQQQNPPSTQTGPSALSALYNQAPKSPQNMIHHSFSPRRTPPPPPTFTSHICDSNLSAEHYLREINSQDTPPVKVVKPSAQNVVYRKEIRIRYLQPPTPPPPAPIIIREKHVPPPPPQSPLLIRERKPEARTPPPLTIRERPPTPPPPLEPYIIEKKLPPPPPQARQIIIERLPTPPPKPRTVIFEKWLPYKKVKRPVLLQKAPPLEPVKPSRNVIIEYEPLKAFTVRRVIEEGVFRVDPHQYSSQNAHSRDGGDVRVVERIEDLPPPSEQLMRVLGDYNRPVTSHSSLSHNYDHCSNTTFTEHVPPSIQNLLADARPISNVDHLTSVSRASSTPAYKQERVLSTGYSSSAPSPTIVPLQRSRSRGSDHRQLYDSPIRSNIDDIY